MATKRRAFGQVRRLPSKRWQAMYADPYGREKPSKNGGTTLLLHRAPFTFDTALDAEAWLMDEHRMIATGVWSPPADRVLRHPEEAGTDVLTFGEYAARWLEQRDLKPRTRAAYRTDLQRRVLPFFGPLPLDGIDAATVRTWYAALDPDKPVTRSHAYGLLRTVMGTAVDDGLVPKNPCHIRGAGTTKRAKKIKPATPEELSVILTHMPEKYRALVLLSAWTALRFGEAAELRRGDIDMTNGVVHVRRGVVRVDGEVIVGTPKTAAGVRDVHIPPHVLPTLQQHLDAMPSKARDALVFPAADGVSHMNPSTLYKSFYPARTAAGRPDLRWHDLRHTGAVLSAQAGATIAELMGRLGHTTPGAAMRYQHASDERDARLARELSRLAKEKP